MLRKILPITIIVNLAILSFVPLGRIGAEVMYQAQERCGQELSSPPSIEIWNLNTEENSIEVSVISMDGTLNTQRQIDNVPITPLFTS